MWMMIRKLNVDDDKEENINEVDDWRAFVF